MKIIWMGSVNWYKDNGYIIDPNTAGAVSASAFEQGIIEGLESSGNEVQIISDWNAMKGKRLEWSHNGDATDVTVAGISSKYAGILFTGVQLVKEIKRNKRTFEQADVIVVYSAKLSYLMAAKYIKEIDKRCKLLFICPDLPQYTDPAIKKKKIKNVLKKIESRIIYNCVKSFDGAVWFSNKMQDLMPLLQFSTVVEGVFSPANLNLTKRKVATENYVMYAGSLSANFGIQNIIKSFELLADLDVMLYIFGTGELESEIKKISEKNPKIKYKGFVNRNLLFEYEKSAMVLINARSPQEEYTKYSFPSKMFEYMVSGNPVLTTKLEGIPEEYYSYVDCLENNQPSNIADHIRTWYFKSDAQRREYGETAKNFILKYKNKNEQSKKIEKLIINMCANKSKGT